MDIKEIHKEIFKGKICPYCRNESHYVDSKIVYGKSYGMIYLCNRCNAYVGVHKGTNQALGRLANNELRKYKIKAHDAFDKLWKSKQMTRTEAYKQLSEHLGIPPEFTHIGMFGVKTCKEVIFKSNQVYQDLLQLDKDFGVGN